MTNITQAVNIAASTHADYWLFQVNLDLPYGDIYAMVAKARAEGSTVSYISEDRFLVNHKAWVNASGCVSPVRISNL